MIQKRVNSAFIGTDLQGRLTEAGIHSLVLAGLTTDHCVSSTARFLRLRSASTRFLRLRSASTRFLRLRSARRRFEQCQHALSYGCCQHALASLNGEFATIQTTEQALNAAE